MAAHYEDIRRIRWTGQRRRNHRRLRIMFGMDTGFPVTIQTRGGRCVARTATLQTGDLRRAAMVAAAGA